MARFSWLNRGRGSRPLGGSQGRSPDPLDGLYLAGPDGVVPFRNSAFLRGDPLFDTDQDIDLERTLAGAIRAYRASVWVYRCIRIRAQAIAAIPLKIVDKQGNDLPGHPLAQLFSDMQSGLIRRTESDLQVFGVAYWSFGYNQHTGQASIKRLNPSTIEVVTDQENFTGPIQYRQVINGKVVHLWQPHELVVFHDYAPDDDMGGVSPVAVALKAIGVTINISAFSEYYFRNGAMPDLILVSQNRLNDSDKGRIEAEWKRRFGGIRKAHGTAILEAGLFDVKVLTPPIKDLAMVELREEERRDICAALGVPMSIAQAADPALYAAKQDYANFHTLTVLPELDLIVDCINRSLMPWFGDGRVVPDTSQVEALQEDLVEISQRNQIGISSGYISLNEAREREGLEPLPVDAFIIGGQLVSRQDLEAGQFDKLRQPAPDLGGLLGGLGGQPSLPRQTTQSITPGVEDTGSASVIDVVVRSVGQGRGLELISSAVKANALEDLRRWRKKVATKGHTTSFQSEYIPPALARFLREDLLAWDGEIDCSEWIKAAFDKTEAILQGDDELLAEFEAYWRDLPAVGDDIERGFGLYADSLMEQVIEALQSGSQEAVLQALNLYLSEAEQSLTELFVGTEQELGPLMALFLAGAQRGAELLQRAGGKSWATKDGIRFNWSLMHRLARDWARKYAADLVRGINETTLEVFRQAIAGWVEKGGSLEDLAKYLQGKLPELEIPEGWSPDKVKWAVSRQRARLIAQTESTRVFTEGSIQQWEQSGVTEAKWRTNVDELVCDVCRSMQNVVGNLRTGWVSPLTGKTYRPPAHPGCRCFLAPIVEKG